MLPIAFLALYFLTNPCHTKSVTSKLYGLNVNVQLVSIDPNTGNMTIINPNNPVTHEGQGENLASLDSKKGVYYFVGTNVTTSTSGVSLIGLSIQDGTVVTEIPLPFASEPLIGAGETCDVDDNNGDVIVMGRGPDINSPHQLLRVTPATGKIKSLATFQSEDVLGGGHGYDPLNNVIWIQTALNQTETNKIFFRLYGFDGITGQTLYLIDDVWYFTNMVFDPKTKMMIGMGYDQTISKDRFLVTLDSTTGRYTNKGVIKGYSMTTSLRTFDVKNRLYYGWFLPDGAKPLDPWKMVEINVDTLEIVQVLTACKDLIQCPWSAECLNK